MSVKIKYEPESKLGTCIYVRELEMKSYIAIKSKKGYSNYRNALFRCFCGKEFECRIDKIKRKDVKSCGCLQKQAMKIIGNKKITHGKSYHPIFPIWRAMINRCQDPNNIGYTLYGERGIKVCKRWQDINNFIEDMYPTYIKGLDIDRTNNNGNYELSNCKWITRKENCNNRRSNRIIEYKGVIKNMKQWSESLNIPYNILMYRLNNWGVEKTFTSQISYK